MQPRLEKRKAGQRKGKKINKNIPKDITEINELIYAEAKLVSDKIGIPLRY